MAKKKTNNPTDLMSCEVCGTPLQLTKLTIDGKQGAYLQCPKCNTLKLVGGEAPEQPEEEVKTKPKKVSGLPPEAYRKYAKDERWFDESLFGFCGRNNVDIAAVFYANQDILKDGLGRPNPYMFTHLKPGTKIKLPEYPGVFNANQGTSFMFQFPTEDVTGFSNVSDRTDEWGDEKVPLE